MEQFIAMVVFSLVTSISPGPVNILATVTGANCGYTRTLPHITGATIGFVSILFCLGLGLAHVINEVPYMNEILTYLGGFFLLYLSYKVITQPLQLEEVDNGDSMAPTFVQGMMCQWLNPKAWIVSLAGISVFMAAKDSPVELLFLFCTVFFVVCFASISVWAILGMSISKVLRTPRHFKVFNVSMGVLLASTILYTFAKSIV